MKLSVAEVRIGCGLVLQVYDDLNIEDLNSIIRNGNDIQKKLSVMWNLEKALLSP